MRNTLLPLLALAAFTQYCKTDDELDVSAIEASDEVDDDSLEEQKIPYESLQDCVKEEFLWGKIVDSRYSGSLPPLEEAEDFALVKDLMFHRLEIKSEQNSDVSPDGWRRPTMKYGTVAAVKFVPEGATKFTGLLQGADCGLLRLSLVEDPFKAGDDSPSRVSPALELKLLVSNSPSANIAALVRPDGQSTDGNFFANELSNMLEPGANPQTKSPFELFLPLSKFPNFLGLQEFGKTSSDGTPVARPHYPFRLYLVPTGSFATDITTDTDFRNELANIPQGSTIYEVWASDPGESNGTRAKSAILKLTAHSNNDRRRAIRIGNLVTKTPFVSSEFGDSGLFFRYRPYGDD